MEEPGQIGTPDHPIRNWLRINGLPVCAIGRGRRPAGSSDAFRYNSCSETEQPAVPNRMAQCREWRCEEEGWEGAIVPLLPWCVCRSAEDESGAGAPNRSTRAAAVRSGTARPYGQETFGLNGANIPRGFSS